MLQWPGNLDWQLAAEVEKVCMNCGWAGKTDRLMCLCCRTGFLATPEQAAILKRKPLREELVKDER